MAFLGGVEEHEDARAIDDAAHLSLLDLGAGSIDVLVTHQGPYGTRIGYHGDVHGSRLMTRLIERVQPVFHVAGHAHSLNGRFVFGRASYRGLGGLVPSAIWQPEAEGFKEGCLAVLDTGTASLRPVTAPWLSEFDTRAFDFRSWFESFTARYGP